MLNKLVEFIRDMLFFIIWNILLIPGIVKRKYYDLMKINYVSDTIGYPRKIKNQKRSY